MITTTQPLEAGASLPFDRACHLFFLHAVIRLVFDLPTRFTSESRFFRRLRGMIQQRHRAIFYQQPLSSYHPVSIVLATPLQAARTELIARFQPPISHALNNLRHHQKRQQDRQTDDTHWMLDHCWSANTLINDTLLALEDCLDDMALVEPTLQLIGQHLLAHLPRLYQAYSSHPQLPSQHWLPVQSHHCAIDSAVKTDTHSPLLPAYWYPRSINARRFQMDASAIGPTLPLSALNDCIDRLARALRDTPLEINQTPCCSAADIMLLLEHEIVRAVRTHQVRMLHPTHNDVLCLVEQRVNGLVNDKQLSAAGVEQVGRLMLPLIKIGIEDSQQLTQTSASPRRLLHILSRLAQADRCALGFGHIEQQHLQRAASLLIATPAAEYLNTTMALSNTLAWRYQSLLPVSTRSKAVVPMPATQNAVSASQQKRQQPIRALVLLSLWSYRQYSTLPGILHRFLNDYWLDVVTYYFNRHGPDTPELNAVCTLTHRIVASLQPLSCGVTRTQWLQKLATLMRDALTVASTAGVTNQRHQTAVHPLLEAHKAILGSTWDSQNQPVVTLGNGRGLAPAPQEIEWRNIEWIEFIINTRQSCQLFLQRAQGCLLYFMALDECTGFAVSREQLSALFQAGLAAPLDTRCFWERQEAMQHYSP